METFGNHVESMRGIFRRSHANVQNVAVVERYSFEEHNEQMKVFHRRNHPVIANLSTADLGGTRKSLNLAEWSALVAVNSVTEHRFSPN